MNSLTVTSRTGCVLNSITEQSETHNFASVTFSNSFCTSMSPSGERHEEHVGFS
uniref:Uncharacterized protein n=1 Tax=Schistosoma japonicum TaxID=6182 RepID=Q5C112_SCHJA|nr:unknown [Schistosoma japonicum]